MQMVHCLYIDLFTVKLKFEWTEFVVFCKILRLNLYRGAHTLCIPFVYLDFMGDFIDPL